jgi:hypothetical protein
VLRAILTHHIAPPRIGSRRTLRSPLPVALDLGALYEHVLAAMIPVPAQPGEGIEARILRLEAIHVKTREVERIAARLGREQQFNKRVAINAEPRCEAGTGAARRGGNSGPSDCVLRGTRAWIS